jgi:hypothetical protein
MIGAPIVCRPRGLSECCMEDILGEYTFCMSRYFICILLCWGNLFVYSMQKLYRFAEGVSEDYVIVVFNNSAQKVIKDAMNMPGTNLSPTTTNMS